VQPTKNRDRTISKHYNIELITVNTTQNTSSKIIIMLLLIQEKSVMIYFDGFVSHHFYVHQMIMIYNVL